MSADPLLAEQIAYYRAIANEYQDHYIEAPGAQRQIDAFNKFDIRGDVLELTCGQGQWTEQLVGRASSVTVVEASPEMITLAKGRVGEASVRFIQADLFSWQSDQRYDTVFFGYWLSHVPEERFQTFWQLVADAVRPDGWVFFVDDNYRTEAELIEGPGSSVVERRLNDGTKFRAIKVPYDASGLERRLQELLWDVTVEESGPFYWGTARPQN